MSDITADIARDISSIKKRLGIVELKEAPVITVEEADGTPSVYNVNKIKFDNTTVTDEGSGVVRVSTTGTNISVREEDGTPSVSDVSIIEVSNGTLTDDGSGVVSVANNVVGTVREIDGTPSVSNVNTIKVTNGTLTDDGGGVVTIDTSGIGPTVREQDGSPSVSDVNTIKVTNGTLTDDGGGVVSINTGGTALTVEEQDGSPSVSNVNTIKFSNGTVTDDGGGEVSVAITPTFLTVEEQDGTPSVSSVTIINFNNGSVTDNGGGEVTVQNLPEVREVDGSPSVNATKIILPNGTLSVAGTEATYNPLATGTSYINGGGRLFTHFLNTIFNGYTLDFHIELTAGGANAYNPDPPSASDIGVLAIRSRDTFSHASLTTALNAILFGGREMYLTWRFMIPTLPTSTNSWFTLIGFVDYYTDSVTDGAYLYYDYNYSNFRYRTESNNSVTDVDSGLAVAANTWYILQIHVNAAGTSVDFTIDGANAQTLTTNIPTGSGRTTGIGASVSRDSSTGVERDVYFDWCDFVWL